VNVLDTRKDIIEVVVDLGWSPSKDADALSMILMQLPNSLRISTGNSDRERGASSGSVVS